MCYDGNLYTKLLFILKRCEIVLTYSVNAVNNIFQGKYLYMDETTKQCQIFISKENLQTRTNLVHEGQAFMLQRIISCKL